MGIVNGLNLINPIDPARLQKETQRIMKSAMAAGAASICVRRSTHCSTASTVMKETSPSSRPPTTIGLSMSATTVNSATTTVLYRRRISMRSISPA
jgi:hypothetical protein